MGYRGRWGDLYRLRSPPSAPFPSKELSHACYFFFLQYGAPHRQTRQRRSAIYQRKSDGLWCASISLDFGTHKVIYGDTRKEVPQKLHQALQRKQ
jgi:hypothetical protein